MTIQNKVSRRNFIKVSGITGAALTLGLYTPTKGAELQLLKTETAKNLGVELNAWISIDTSGKVTIINHRAEMGQGAFQTVPQMIAEELEVDLNQVNIVFGIGNENKYGSQITGGSSTVRSAYKHLLRMGASAREMLIKAAAKKWSVDSTTCHAENGNVIHRPSKRNFIRRIGRRSIKTGNTKNCRIKEDRGL